MAKINYMHVMSEKEIEESNRKIEEWWTNLESHLKLYLYNTNKTLFEQMYCAHEFKSPSSGNFEYCFKCNFSKEK